MGCGLYSYSSATSRTKSYSTKSREQVFVSRKMFEEMNIKGKVRECCETTEHPNTLPIIIGLDVTGSMGYIPELLIKKHLPEIVSKVIEAGVEHPEICFVAFGDDVYDDAPIQVGQFESSDELIEKWLVHSWLEGGGGGNDQEAAGLVHYFAAYHTKCDAFKRGQKGVLITISDENPNKKSSKHSIKELFGDDIQADVETSTTIDKCSKNWNIYHVNVDDATAKRQHANDNWSQLIGSENVSDIPKTENMEDLVPVLVDLIVKSYDSTKENTTSTTTINML